MSYIFIWALVRNTANYNALLWIPQKECREQNRKIEGIRRLLLTDTKILIKEDALLLLAVRIIITEYFLSNGKICFVLSS